MSAVCVLTPVVIASWPAISAAIIGAAASMGFSLKSEGCAEAEPRRRRVETEVPNSEVVKEGMAPGQKIVVQNGDLTIEFGVDQRGACSVCVTGEGKSDLQLRKIGEEVAGRIVQQFAYHKLMTELKKRNYSVVEEKTLADQSVQVRIRL